jgi:hypothetical protein
MRPREPDDSLLSRLTRLLENPFITLPLVFILLFLIAYFFPGSSGGSVDSLYRSFRRW